MPTYLDFEKPIADLEGKIAELRHQGSGDSAGIDIADEVAKLQAKVERQIRTTYTKLTAWQRPCRSRATPSGRMPSTTSPAWSRSSRRWPATAASPRTLRSWAGWAASPAVPP